MPKTCGRRTVHPVSVGGWTLGDGTVRVQSMLSVPAGDIEGSVRQARELEAAGCEILRAAIPDREALALIPALKEAVSIPIVADIHYDYRLALGAVERGIDKVRINPGNIGDDDRVKAVADACGRAGVPIRVGVNSGSLEKHILEKHGSPTPAAMAESALYHASLLERFDFHDIVVSMKSADPAAMMAAYRLLAEQCDYPLHLGVTHAGTLRMGVLKNAIGIGSLLLDGIGDTIRVSLTASPTEEVRAGYDILKAAGVRRCGPEIIACPTCGRTAINLIDLAEQVETALADCKKDIRVAVMGCVVNGPGEAREADIGVAGGKGCGVIFRGSELLRKVPEEEILPALLEEIEKL